MGPHPLGGRRVLLPKSSPRRRNQNKNHGMDVVSTDVLGRVRPAQAKTRKSTCTFTGAHSCSRTLAAGTAKLPSLRSSRVRPPLFVVIADAQPPSLPGRLAGCPDGGLPLLLQTGLCLLRVSSPPGRRRCGNLALHLLR